MEQAKPSPRMVLAAYAERLLEGRRVVVFGDSTSGLAEHLVERGARLVHVYDADLGRVAEATTQGASRNISFAPLGQGGIAVRDGAFDIGIIDNLAEADDPAGLLRRMRRALAARGIAFIAAPNLEVEQRLLPDSTRAGPSYYELYDLAGAEFDEVRMLGQTPFIGYAVTEFSEESSDEYSIDTAFVPGGAEEPEYYIALASHFPVSLDAYCVVQLPADSLLQDTDSGSEAKAQAESLRRQLSAVERKLAEAQKREPKPDDHSKRLLKEANQELARRDAWVSELEGRAATADERADDAESELEPLRLEVKQLTRALQTANQKSQALAQERDLDVRKQVSELEQQLRTLTESHKRERNKLKLDLTAARASAAESNAVETKAHETAILRRRNEAAEKELSELKRALSEAHRELKQHSVEQEEVQQQEQVAKQRREQEQQSQGLATSKEQESLGAELETLRKRVKSLLSELTETKKQLESASEFNRELTADLANLEAQLWDRGREVARLAVSLSKTENFGEQLLWQLEATASPVEQAPTDQPSESNSGAPADLKSKLDTLAAANARHVADLTAAEWSIKELESKLEAANKPSSEDLSTELERAKAEIQRQSTLIQQFRDRASV